MQPIVFKFAEVRSTGSLKLGVGPSFQGMLPLLATCLQILETFIMRHRTRTARARY